MDKDSESLKLKLNGMDEMVKKYENLENRCERIEEFCLNILSRDCRTSYLVISVIL